jgi:uncharacterized protein (TIGR02268 family)
VTELIIEGAIDEDGVTVQKFTLGRSAQAREEGLEVHQGRLYRAHTSLVLELTLKARPGTKPWVTEGAALVRSSGVPLELWVLQPEPLSEGESGTLWLELPVGAARGTVTLRLWDEGKARTVTLPDLKLP